MFFRKRKLLEMAPQETDRWLIISPGVQISADEEGLTFLNTLTGRIFVDNRIAALIWFSASSGLSIEKTAEDLSKRFGIAQDRAERDIRVFVEHLERAGLAVQGVRKP